MYTQAILLSVLAACAEARFGQEQTPIAAIGAVTSGGGPGEAATLAGGSIQFLLAAANPCAKLVQADKIVATLGTGADSIAAARGLVAAEQNFNPFVVSVPSICSDPTLPTTEALRGIVPLIDPAVTGSDTENALSAQSVVTPFTATGMSVADVMVANGFSNFTTKAQDGTVGTPGGAVAAPVASGVASSVVAPSSAVETAVAVVSSSAIAAPAATDCGSTVFVTVTRAAGAASSAVVGVGNGTEASSVVASSAAPAATGAAPATGGTTTLTGGEDFGLCTPTMDFVAGRPGRKATESTFLPTDPLVAQGQQDALNPNIITNRICDQLTNVCNANDAAKTACLAAKAQIAALGTKDQTTADAWNSALGF